MGSMDLTDCKLPPILRPLPDHLLGERVLVRPLRSEDGQAIWEAVEESRDQLRLWMPWVDASRSPADTEEYVRRAQARWLLREAELPFSVWERASGRFLGNCDIQGINWSVPSCDFGYWLRVSALGQGYMTEAVALLCRLAFETLGAQRVAIRCDAQNLRSAALARRLGFVHEATLRNECRDPQGELRDTLVFALTPPDYEQMPRKASDEL